jgi:hypothetical protein
MQYSHIFDNLLGRPAREVGTITGIAAGVVFGAFIGIALRSLLFGTIEGVIFGAVTGAFFAWRIHERDSIPVERLNSWTPSLTLAFVVGILIALALFIESLVQNDVGLVIAWAIAGVVYATLVGSVPAMNRRQTRHGEGE